MKEEKRERKPAIDLSVIGTKIAKPLTPVVTRKRDVKAEEKNQAVEKKQDKIIAAVVSPKKAEPVKVKEPEVKRVSRSTVAEAVKSVSKSPVKATIRSASKSPEKVTPKPEKKATAKVGISKKSKAIVKKKAAEKKVSKTASTKPKVEAKKSEVKPTITIKKVEVKAVSPNTRSSKPISKPTISKTKPTGEVLKKSA